MTTRAIRISMVLLALLVGLGCTSNSGEQANDDGQLLALDTDDRGTIDVLSSAGAHGNALAGATGGMLTADGSASTTNRNGSDDQIDSLAAGMSARANGGGTASAAEVAATEVPEPCDNFDGEIRPFQTSSGARFGDVAGEFKLTMLDGSAWSFEAHWSGCESYVFLTYFPDLRLNRMGLWEGDLLWDSPLDEIMLAGPSNTHYVFISDEESEADRIDRLESMRNRIDEALNRLIPSETDRVGWRRRMHLTTTRLTDVDGSVGEMARAYLSFAFDPDNRVDLGERGKIPAPLPYVFGIDRLQRFDAGGNLSPAVGQVKVWAMTAYLGHFYNHHAQLRDTVAAEDNATIINMLDGRVSERVFTVPVTLPDPMAMAAFDRMAFDISVTCPHLNPFGCSEWDRLAHIFVCLDNECMERREIVRWITPYWRRGERRWLMDASPFIGLLRSGGAQSFRVEMGPGWERKTERDVTVNLRLWQTDGPRATGAVRVYTGGGFNADYNANHPPTSFDLPAEVDRVELVTIISGHGQEETNGCAEWCDHRHQFTVNGEALESIVSAMRPGTSRGCAQRANEGVSPGQWGNWAQSRAFWCPGLPVEAQRIEITDKVQLGSTNELTYQTSLRLRETPPGGDVNLSAYIVWYLN
ncbi:MAG: peptide-N-glycosidase F-related protein [Myxococcota bacterium]|nr:peptide-N-glycosidase F-related protein [Myxococcota bacterium]